MKKKLLGLLVSLLVACIVTGLLILVIALIMYKLELSQTQVGLFVILIYGIAGIVSGFVYCKIKGCKRLLNGALMGLVYFVLIAVISCIYNKGLGDDMGKTAISMIVCVVGGILGGIMS